MRMNEKEGTCFLAHPHHTLLVRTVPQTVKVSCPTWKILADALSMLLSRFHIYMSVWLEWEQESATKSYISGSD